MGGETKEKSAIGADCVPGEADTRPEASPYAASIVNLQLKDGTILRIPSPLLRKFPKLPYHSQWSQTVRLDITQEVGHTLAHYLFTNTYQCLRPKGRSPPEKVAAEFTTSIRVYALAREYELFSLEELAKLEIERLGTGLRFSMVLDLVRDAYPDPSADDTWFSSYLKSALESLLQNPSELSDCVTPNAERKTLSVSDLLFKNLVELVHNHDILPLAPNALVEVPEESAFVMPAPELGPPEEAAPRLDDSDFPKICEPDLEPEKSQEEDIWSFTVSKKTKDKKRKKKKKAQTIELEPEPEPEPARELHLEPEPEKSQEEDIWDFTVSKKTKDKKGKKKKVQTLEPDLESGNEPEADPEHEPLEVVAPEEEVEAAPAATDDWSYCESDGKETNPTAGCNLRAEHVLGNGWEECYSCQDFIRQLSVQLPSRRC